MEKIIAQLFGSDFSSIPAPLQKQIKDMKTDHLSQIGNFFTKISKIFEGLQSDNSPIDPEDPLFLSMVQTQISQNLEICQTILNSTHASIESTIENFENPKNPKKKSKKSKTQTKKPKSFLKKREKVESDEEEISQMLDEQAEQDKQEIEDKPVKKQKMPKINSQTFAVPRRKYMKKTAKTQLKDQPTQKSTTATMVMMSQIDQTVPDSSSSEDEDKMQISTIQATPTPKTNSGQKSGSSVKVNKNMLFSQIPQGFGDDSDDSDEDDDGGKNSKNSTPTFNAPDVKKDGKKDGKNGRNLRGKNVRKKNVNKFSLMSQIPTVDDDDDSESEEVEDMDVKAPAVKTRAVKDEEDKQKKMEVIDLGDDSKYLIHPYEIAEIPKSLDSEYVSSLVVKNHNTLIVGGRWFGIWELQRDQSEGLYICKNKLVTESKNLFFNFSKQILKLWTSRLTKRDKCITA
jgi:hypothetical protein